MLKTATFSPGEGPFNDTRRYNAAGELCSCELFLCDCEFGQDSVFVDLTRVSTDYVREYVSAPLRPVAGSLNFEGSVRHIELSDTRRDR
jgi:hypothetical protein